MKLYIKNMVCPRCIAAVRSIFIEEGINPVDVDLGEVRLSEEELTPALLQTIDRKLNGLGFERISDSKSRIIEKIKATVIENIHHNKSIPTLNWSAILTDSIPHDYKYLSQLFSAVEGITIEQYIIRQKVEKAKELMTYNELNTSEIAYKLGYSSVPHFSSQFKKVTGMTPSEFKKLQSPLRKSLDNL